LSFQQTDWIYHCLIMPTQYTNCTIEKIVFFAMQVPMSSRESAVADVETWVINYLWNHVSDTTFVQRVLKNMLYTFELDMSCLDISRETMSLTGPSSSNNVTNKKDKILCKAKFVNKSNETQHFTFKTDKSTTSTYEISLSCGLKKWGKLELRIPLLPVRRFSLDWIESQEFLKFHNRSAPYQSMHGVWTFVLQFIR
jgi:hypothetical protein